MVHSLVTILKLYAENRPLGKEKEEMQSANAKCNLKIDENVRSAVTRLSA